MTMATLEVPKQGPKQGTPQAQILEHRSQAQGAPDGVRIHLSAAELQKNGLFRWIFHVFRDFHLDFPCLVGFKQEIPVFSSGFSMLKWIFHIFSRI